jgi:hypothetical protein
MTNEKGPLWRTRCPPVFCFGDRAVDSRPLLPAFFVEVVWTHVFDDPLKASQQFRRSGDKTGIGFCFGLWNIVVVVNAENRFSVVTVIIYLIDILLRRMRAIKLPRPRSMRSYLCHD